VGAKLYELTDHLGNVLAVIGDVKLADGTSFKVDLMSYTNNYPYGMPQPLRSWSGGGQYRYGYNGQEKSDEISGEGNHTTAFYWEYSTRIGRRWNLDPKPNPSISQYAVFAGNPILYSDELGDTNQVTNDTHFWLWEWLFPDENYTLNYHEGKYYNQDGTAYTGELTDDNKEMLGYLKRIESTTAGRKLLADTYKSANNNLLRFARWYESGSKSTNYQDPNARYYDAVKGQSGAGTSATVIIDRNDFTTGAYTIINNQIVGTTFTGETILTHELAHARDANYGEMSKNSVEFPRLDGSKFVFKSAESQAVYVENQVRGELGMDLRFYYGVEIVDGKQNAISPLAVGELITFTTNGLMIRVYTDGKNQNSPSPNATQPNSPYAILPTLNLPNVTHPWKFK
jgi:hypothetical protein